MIEKIKALLALAANPAAAPQEAETAARQAAKLMAKHDLDEFDLLVAGQSDWDLTQGVATGCRPGKKNAREVPPWIGIIAFGVKTYCNVRAGNTWGEVQFRGRRADVELAIWMHNRLVQMAWDASKRASEKGTAFRNGYAAAVQSRLKKMAADRDREVEQEVSNAGVRLVVVKDRLAQAMNERWGAEAGGRSSKVQQGMSGYSAGLKANLPTARPISNSAAAGYLS